MDNVKFSYIEDNTNRHRRLTIARMVENGTIFYSVAMNRCKNKETFPTYGTKGFIVRSAYPIDLFRKDMGRTICLTRLSNSDDHTKIPQDLNEAPHITVLKHIAKTSDNHTMRRMAREYLNPVSTRSYRERKMDQTLRMSAG